MKLKNYVRCLFFIFSIATMQVVAQQDAQFSHYMFVNPYINPASCGINNTTDISFIYRYQWLGYNTTNNDINASPQTQLLTASTKIREINSGIGLYLLNDRIGPLSNFNAKVSYSYHINISENVKLGVGVRLGVFNQSINTDAWRPSTPVNLDNRLLFLASNSSGTNFDFGMGLWLQATNFFMGFSMSHLNRPVFFVQNAGNFAYDQSYIYRHYYLNAGYIFTINENWKLVPTILVKSDLLKFDHTQFDFSALMKFNNDNFWGGLSYRFQDAMILLVGVGLLKDHSLRIGYGFDLIVTGNSAKSATSHEIMITFTKPVAELIPKPIIRTPRFRF